MFNNWIILGLISSFAFALINVTDRKFLFSLKAHPLAYPALAVSLGTLFTAGFSIF